MSELIQGLEQVAREYNFLTESLKNMKAKKEKLRLLLIKELDTGKHPVGKYEVLIKDVPTTRLSSKDVKIYAPDVYELYSKTSESTRVTVKIVDEL